MKHLEKLQQIDQRVAKSKDAGTKYSKFKLLLASILLIASIGSGMQALFSSHSTDNLSESEKSELVTVFANLKTVTVEQVAAKDIDAALNSTGLPADQRQLLKSSLTQNVQNPLTSPTVPNPETKDLVWLTLWDFASPDGDIVHISSAGYEMDIPILKMQNRIAVPVDATRTVNITGTYDGGGGITLGIQSGASPISLPVLSVGQVLTIPVVY